jgi:hypothetical protein
MSAPEHHNSATFRLTDGRTLTVRILSYTFNKPESPDDDDQIGSIVVHAPPPRTVTLVVRMDAAAQALQSVVDQGNALLGADITLFRVAVEHSSAGHVTYTLASPTLVSYTFSSHGNAEIEVEYAMIAEVDWAIDQPGQRGALVQTRQWR